MDEQVAVSSPPTLRERVFARTAFGALAIAGVSLAAMTLVEAWQVIARYVLNDSPGWTEPVAILCMNTAMMFGAAAAVRAETHFGFSILVHAAPRPVRLALLGLARFVAAALGAVLAVWGARLALEGWDVKMAGAALPQGAAYLPITLGGALIALLGAERLLSGDDVRPPGH